MKRIAVTLWIGLLIFCSLSLKAHAGSQDFTLKNRLGVTIYQVFVSPVTSESWGNDLLGDDVLMDGYNLPIHFSWDTTERWWDLKVVLRDGRAYTWTGQNAFNLNTLTWIELCVRDGHVCASHD